MNINSSLLNEWAEAVREAYMVNDIHPNDMVEEIAEANDLNIEQIKRLCESSNLTIKRALKKGKVDDVSFPLASFQTVLDNLQPEAEVTEMKEASLIPDTPLKQFYRHILTGKGGMKKEAAAPELNESILAEMVEHTRQQHMKARREVTLQKHVTEKLASRIVDYIADDFRKNFNANSSYTVAREYADPELVDKMYKLAHKLIVEDHEYEYPEPELMKLGSRLPNPDSEIVKLFDMYGEAITKLAELNKVASAIKISECEVDQKLRKFLIGDESSDE